MSKYTRKQRTAPEDEFVSFWEKVFKRIEPYARAIGITAVTAAVLIAAVWGATSFSEHKQQVATEDFGRAVRIYEAELLTTDEPPKTTEEIDPIPRFKTEKERADATLKALDEFDGKHGSSGTAHEAKLFRAGVYFDQGRIDDAATAYAKFLEDKHPSPLVAVAREGLGLCKEQQGKLDEALAEYQQLEPKTGDYYRDRALWDEARVLTKKNDKKGAAEKLKELVAKTPTSPLKDEAQNQIAQLEGQ
ncbi:MAG TPA: tetratricopeptide repeat protein [Polyangia bacterium]|jgi:predicted negative regulator of RcsB-dependent stress response|nr:tetratricopeptide repeat protein [Polyangia bacterium]HWE27337.1 tetratricopeptide repeat protein [Polyangia bacterium]